MVTVKIKKYNKNYNKDMFQIRGGFTGWHALYLLVPVFVAALIPYMYLTAQSTLSMNTSGIDNVAVVANIKPEMPAVNTVESFKEPTVIAKSRIIFVGDSITRGAMNCNYTTLECDKAVETAVSKEIELLGTEEFAGMVVNSTSQTTADALIEKMDVDEAEIAQVMLGTNDASLGVSNQEFKNNMNLIIAKLLNSGVEKVVVNKPIFSPAIADKINELWEFLQMAPSIFDVPQVFKGDEAAFDWFAERSYLLDGEGGGFHPDEFGYSILGDFWAKALQKVIASDTIVK